jgi:large exoprotein involved in heme utilization and adhesion
MAPSIVVDGSFIGTAPLSNARTAEVEMMVDRLTLTNLGLIVSITNSNISAGTITINATDTVSISTGGIFTSTFGMGTGEAGNIVVNTAHLQLTQGGRIDSSALGPGDGGTVTITASGTVSIAGRNSGIFTNTVVSGAGGTIALQAQQVRLTEGALISSASSGSGNAGDIRIAAQDVELRGDSVITTTVDRGEASGGSILIGGTINAQGDIVREMAMLTLEGSRITANTDAGDGANIVIGARQAVLDSGSAISANTNAGSGGNVTMAGTVAVDGRALSRAGTIILRESQITASAQAGQGGRIDIVAEVFLADPDSVIDASSQVGIDGEVNIEAVVSNLSEVVEPLSQRLASEILLLRDRCATRLHQGLVSSFVERERAGIPSAPDGLLPSRLGESDAEVAWSGESRSHGMAVASEPSWRLSSGCP